MITMIRRLNFKLHLDEVLLKANRTLGFILRFTSIFRDQSFQRNLYCALVRPILEYASIIWNPPTIDGCSRIECIQLLFTRIAFRRLFGAARPNVIFTDSASVLKALHPNPSTAQITKILHRRDPTHTS